MYHYRESGLPNIYLVNGYHEVETPDGPGIAIDDVRGLHEAIVRDLVMKPALTGAEVRFIRKFLDLTQAAFADLLGVEEQSARRWEKLSQVPTPADRAVRLVAREALRAPEMPFAELVRHLATARAPARHRYRRRGDWKPDRAAA